MTGGYPGKPLLVNSVLSQHIQVLSAQGRAIIHGVDTTSSHPEAILAFRFTTPDHVNTLHHVGTVCAPGTAQCLDVLLEHCHIGCKTSPL